MSDEKENKSIKEQKKEFLEFAENCTGCCVYSLNNQFSAIEKKIDNEKALNFLNYYRFEQSATPILNRMHWQDKEIIKGNYNDYLNSDFLKNFKKRSKQWMERKVQVRAAYSFIGAGELERGDRVWKKPFIMVEERASLAQLADAYGYMMNDPMDNSDISIDDVRDMLQFGNLVKSQILDVILNKSDIFNYQEKEDYERAVSIHKEVNNLLDRMVNTMSADKKVIPKMVSIDKSVYYKGGGYSQEYEENYSFRVKSYDTVGLALKLGFWGSDLERDNPEIEPLFNRLAEKLDFYQVINDYADPMKDFKDFRELIPTPLVINLLSSKKISNEEKKWLINDLKPVPEYESEGEMQNDNKRIIRLLKKSNAYGIGGPGNKGYRERADKYLEELEEINKEIAEIRPDIAKMLNNAFATLRYNEIDEFIIKNNLVPNYKDNFSENVVGFHGKKQKESKNSGSYLDDINQVKIELQQAKKDKAEIGEELKNKVRNIFDKSSDVETDRYLKNGFEKYLERQQPGLYQELIGNQKKVERLK